MPAEFAQFVYRRNWDGTWDSICKVCYQIVGTEPSFNALLGCEQAHKCSGDLTWLNRQQPKDVSD
jgi:hypothetical protein